MEFLGGVIRDGEEVIAAEIPVVNLGIEGPERDLGKGKVLEAIGDENQ